jgi:hypothetical protein
MFFRKSRDQAISLGERCPAFEKKPGTALWQPIEESVQGPADPEILFHVLDGRSEPCGGAEEKVQAILFREGHEPGIIGIHHGSEGIRLNSFFGAALAISPVG